MNRLDYINKINTYAARFVLEVEGFNTSNLYDINIHAESFLIPILNEVFGLRLENLNSSQKKNYPAIDLADFSNRVAFQVTATNDFSKIKTTLKKFMEHQLNKTFDVLYIYIITHKKDKYDDAKLQECLPQNFAFTTSDNVIDKDDLLKKIASISSTPKIEAISKIYTHEFSDTQIAIRAKAYVNGCLNTENELIVPNLLSISFPQYLYQAELNIDEKAIVDNLNAYLLSVNKKPVKKLKPRKLVKKALKPIDAIPEDWVLYEKLIYTFRNLDDINEPLSKIVDKGTIMKIGCKEYYGNDENHLKVFKNLLRNTLVELGKLKEIEWFGKKRIFRFANNQDAPNQKSIRWKGKKEATKTVIFEMMDKQKDHIICFRNLAFKSTFYNIGDEWYLILNPTWSFTNPGGYNQSRFEASYLSGIKKLEINSTIYNYFRFFGYYLSYKDLFTPSYPHMEINVLEPLTISPKLDERVWKPVKVSDKKTKDADFEFTVDNELTDNTLF